MRISNLSRWTQGYFRRRNERRMQRFQSATHRPLQRAALAILWLHLAFVALIVASCTYGSTAHAQPIPREAQRYQLTLKREAQLAWGLQAPVATFAAQVHQESRWRLDARSPVGAEGLAQFMPSTAKWIAGLSPSLNPCSAPERTPDQDCLVGFGPTNPTWALRGLVTYDKWLADRIRADDPCQDMAFALSAYNGGLGWVYKRQKLSRQPGLCLGATCQINPGITAEAQQENQHYPELILGKYEPLYASWGMGACQ
jgi:soluble lytic murein transglycosylase-like protein